VGDAHRLRWDTALFKDGWPEPGASG
jgi:hypothetical protein